MKWKRTLALAIVFSLLGSGSMLFADSVTERIRVIINGQEVSGGGYFINGTTYAPVREISGLASWDSGNGKVTITKPNVHITLFKGETVFGNVNVGKLKFNVLSQVDSLDGKISEVKVAITDPSGNVKNIQSEKLGSGSKDNFWFRTNDFTYDFKKSGNYKVGFYMKPSGSNSFFLVSEKVITALD
ncbi:copper amine oxidase [Paenibacillus urinalis]|uniref:Copper amine oxidase n=1 Tax=Paenibacillus urinalis TaxID=521520 RepID=A0AAX3MVP6_9BACL|nr:copper amine oxidase [Paenibacillus urinalis]WDH81478.1 copper amine oxidase [Paenibacillus urinalis]